MFNKRSEIKSEERKKSSAYQLGKKISHRTSKSCQIDNVDQLSFVVKYLSLHF